ncbi:MAG: glutamate--tRNA ligase family protein [Nanoarchaeota archaeon]
MIKNLDKKIRAYALKNAIAYNGKANSGSVLSSLFNEGLKKEEVNGIMPKIQQVIKEIEKLSLSEQEKEYEKLHEVISERHGREGLPELPNAKKGKVIMRFRPAPSGPLHVGHIISNLASSLYVKKYGGKFYVIIDDTDPETTVLESYKRIKEDCDWIFGNVHKYLNSSDMVENHYEYAEKLIKKDSAYVCICSQENFKKFSLEKRNCPCRNLSVKENLERWKKMLGKKGYRFSQVQSVSSKLGQYKEGEAVLRFKTPNEFGGMSHKNPAMRDFPLARINVKSHPIQKNKYRVWPLMNLAVAVDDMEYRMTHIIRGKDHKDNAERQKMMFKVFNKEYPWTFFIGRIKFTDLVLSKRKISSLIKAGEFSGHDDEKLPTISSLKKRGYKPETFVKFIEQRGLTGVDKVISGKDFFESLDVFNR